MARLYLTGGSGFLGKHIFERWDGDSYLHTRGQDFEYLPRYNPDYIIHSAAEIYKEEEMFESNVVLTHNILEAAKEVENLKAMICIGSSSEYGLKDHPISEQDTLEPFHPYAATKGAASLMAVSLARKYKLPIMVARPFSVFGKHEPQHRYIPTAIRNIKAGWKLSIAPGSHDFIHVDDLIDGLFAMLDNPKPGEIYNFGTGRQFTNIEVANMIDSFIERKMNYEEVGQMREFDTDFWVCDNSKAQKGLRWNPKINFEEGIRKLCRS